MKKIIILTIIFLLFSSISYANSSETFIYTLEGEIKSAIIADFIDNVYVCPDGYYQLSSKPHICCLNGYIERSDGACCVLSDDDDCYCPEGQNMVEPFICCPDGPPTYMASQNKKKCIVAECPEGCKPTQFEGMYCGSTSHLEFENQKICCSDGWYAPDPNINICCRNGSVLKDGEQYCVYNQSETVIYGLQTLSLSCCIRDTDLKRNIADWFRAGHCARVISCKPCCPKGQEWNLLELKCGPIIPIELQIK